MSERQTITCRTPEDVLAVVPVALRFNPTDSLVMLTFGERAFHARIDLPDQYDRDEWELVASTMASPAVQHGHTMALLVLYTDNIKFGQNLGRYVAEKFNGLGVNVPEVFVTDGLRYWTTRHEAVPYRAEVVPLRDNQPTPAASRDELDAQLRPDPAAQALVVPHLGDRPVDREEGKWVNAVLHYAIVLDDADLGRFASALTSELLRDVAFCTVAEGGRLDQLYFLLNCVGRTPDSHLAHMLDLVGFTAYMQGNGALAWCAVDRSMAHGDTAWAMLLTLAMEQAMNPRDYESPSVESALAALDGAS